MDQSLVVIGFSDETTLVEYIAHELGTKAIYGSTTTFAAGELQVSVPRHTEAQTVVLATNIRAIPESLWRACFLSALERARGAKQIILLSPWIAYGRQDRIVEAEIAPGGLLVGQWLQEAFDHLYTLDAHSQRFIDAFQGKLQNLHGSPLLFPSLSRATIVVAPDEGAKERATSAAALLKIPVAVLTKKREGKNVTITLPKESVDWSSHIPLLVDDMTDSGGTLISAAKVLKNAGSKEILAFVPHILRGDILRSRAEGVINTIEMVYDHEANVYALDQLSLLTTQFLHDQRSS